MAYATLSDLETRYGSDPIWQLADRDDDGTLDAGVVESALADATHEINGYLAVRNSLPLATVPEMLVRLCADIARYRLWGDRATENIRQGYEDARDALRQLASGAAKLLIAEEPAPAQVAATPGSRVQFTHSATLDKMP
jgi:phage gp36-like protein